MRFGFLALLLSTLYCGCMTGAVGGKRDAVGEVIIVGKRVYVRGRRRSPGEVVQALQQGRSSSLGEKQITVCVDGPDRETFIEVTGRLRRYGYQFSVTGPPVTVTILDRLYSEVDGQRMRHSQLATHLRQTETIRSTMITLKVTDKELGQLAQDISGLLNKAGYYYILFNTPREASAYVTPVDERRRRPR